MKMQKIKNLNGNFFGAVNGIHRSFPGKKNCDNTYDPRKRPWFF